MKDFYCKHKNNVSISVKGKKAHLEATARREQNIIKLFVEQGKKKKSNWWSHEWSCVSLVLN